MSKRSLAAFLAVSVSSSAMSAQCPGAHCSSISVEINNICKSDGFSGNVVYVLGPGGASCYCNCSCLSYGSLVSVGSGRWKKIEDFKVGDKVLTLQRDGKWKESEVKFSDGTSGDGRPVPFTVFIELDNGVQLIVTPDHPFLLPNGMLKRASKLSLSDMLMSAEQKPVLLKRIEFGTYTGGIHNISTSKSSQKEDKYEHLINTGGIISGDYYAQLYLVDDDDKNTPEYGTTEYTASVKTMDSGLSNKENDQIEPRALGTYFFTPYKKFKAPPGAVHFFPEGTEAKPGTLKPLSDPVPREIADYLVHQYKRFYPEIEFHVEWADNTVNAYAWVQNGVRQVALLGGLIRHQAIGVEGLSLVTAHEIGHHRGGQPTYPNSPLSCEGQADYWGASSGMREVWWGPEYIRQMQAAIPQLDQLFQGVTFTNQSSLESFLPDGSAAASLSCGHPPAACRKATYQAALEAKPKPICAGVSDAEPATPKP